MSISDQFAAYKTGLTGPLTGGFDITPDDNTDLPTLQRALMVADGGDVALVFKDGSSWSQNQTRPHS